MALLRIPNVSLRGISACVPKNVVSNHDYSWISVKEREQIIKTVGVETKRLAPIGITTGDLGLVAAEKLIEELNWNKEEIDLLIFVSQSRDYLLPATACILQDKLKLPKTTMALDISLGCSGYVYGLSVMSSLLSSGLMKKGLLIVGDTSTYSSYRDKTSYPLFGDAACVTALEYAKGNEDIFFNLQTDGSGYEAIIVRGGGARMYPDKKLLKYKSYGKGIIRNMLQPQLKGIEVFNFSLREVVPNIQELLAFSGHELNKTDYFVLHQANRLINETIRKLLKVEKEKWPYSIHKYGNTSSASIPLTIVSELKNETRDRKLKMILCGFGVGLSWGSVLIETEGVICPEVIEHAC